MGFRASRPTSFVIGVGLRSVLIAALAFLALWLVFLEHLYATALVVAIVIAVVVANLVSVVNRASRWLEDDLERLTAEVSDLPTAVLSLKPGGVTPLDRARAVLNAARTERQRHADYLQTLLDTVSAALFVIHDDERVTLVNRAAIRFAGAAVDRFEQIDAIGARAARTMLAMHAGARQVVALADGRQVFVAASSFSVPGRPAQRLLALQRIAGDLDAVELKAWQDMVQVLTHEMMNSLTPISSLSESLETLLRSDASARGAGASGAIAEDVAGALEAIKRRSLGLMGFVERYRAVAELPSPQRQPVNLQALLSGIDRLIGPVLREKGVEFRTSIVPPDLSANADPQLLEQAMINLLRNAADAVAGVEHPRIEVKCEERDGQVRLAVCDNGAGVPESQRDQIFVPFFTTKPGGSGIGLNLARHIALGHGGGLDVRSAEPNGSVFTLSLPATLGGG